ncbi:hypothetical protein BJ138DRAFT_1167090 [Hygrophoropsis aurantiaca]|uniref:Uncharacterized protein n=1 Tax=Hygrophoropsis aurantiaca TaxID=72124 RepID=A0ACB7ZUW4_9AGAM|nr:hypothetical protein BJ138DRAFT_1167090 [Hygrophoropsis aurantiaca]
MRGGKKAADKAAIAPPTFVFDERPVTAVPSQLMSRGADELTLQAMIDKSVLGYAKYHLLDGDSKIKFGLWNDRRLVEDEAKKVMASIEREGMMGFLKENMMPIVVRKSDIDAMKITKDDSLGAGLPELTLKRSEVDIQGASGQHRMWAVQKIFSNWKKEADLLEAGTKKIIGKRNPTDIDHRNYNGMRQQLGVIKGNMNEFGWWGVKVYDAEVLLKDGNAAAKRLSQNKVLYEYVETEEEKMVAFIRELDAAPKSHYAKLYQDMKEKAVKTSSKMSRVIHCEEMVRMLSLLLKLGPYFRSMKKMSLPFMSSVIDTHAGFLYMFVDRCCTVYRQLASPDPFPSYAEIKGLLDSVVRANDKEATEYIQAKTKLHEYQQQILRAKRGGLDIFKGAIGEIDVVFKAEIRHPSRLGIFDDDNDNDIQTYGDEVVKRLQAFWRKNLIGPAEDSDIYNKILARTAVWFCPVSWSGDRPTPLLSPESFLAAHDSMSKYKHSIREICRWFEPLVDFLHQPITRSQDFSDFTCSMFNVIQRSPWFKVEDKVTLKQEIFYAFWNNRDNLFLPLEYMVTDEEVISKRLVSKAELAKHFEKPKDVHGLSPDEFKARSIRAAQAKALSAAMLEATKAANLHEASRAVKGMAGMLTTTWEFADKGQNKARDWNPCIHYLLFEMLNVAWYRPAIFVQPVVELRKHLFDCVAKYDSLKNSIGYYGDVQRVPNFSWWDELVLPADPEAITDDEGNELSLEAMETAVRQRASVQADFDEIQGLVKKIEASMAARYTEVDEDGKVISYIAEDVSTILQTLAVTIAMNSDRNRFLAEHSKDTMKYDPNDFQRPDFVFAKHKLNPRSIPRCNDQSNGPGYAKGHPIAKLTKSKATVLEKADNTGERQQKASPDVEVDSEDELAGKSAQGTTNDDHSRDADEPGANDNGVTTDPGPPCAHADKSTHIVCVDDVDNAHSSGQRDNDESITPPADPSTPQGLDTSSQPLGDGSGSDAGTPLDLPTPTSTSSATPPHTQEQRRATSEHVEDLWSYAHGDVDTTFHDNDRQDQEDIGSQRDYMPISPRHSPDQITPPRKNASRSSSPHSPSPPANNQLQRTRQRSNARASPPAATTSIAPKRARPQGSSGLSPEMKKTRTTGGHRLRRYKSPSPDDDDFERVENTI